MITGGPIFESNDDPGMILRCAGIGYGAKPDEHILFAPFITGLILSKLYAFADSVPWYALGQVGCQFLSMTVILRVLMAKSKGTAGTAIGITGLLVFCLVPVVMMQYTTTSALLGTAGGLLLIANYEMPDRNSLKRIAPGVLLFLLSCLVRLECAELILGLTGVYLLLRLVSRRSKSRFAYICIALGISSAIVFGIGAANRAYYDHGLWKEYYPLQWARVYLLERDFQPDVPIVEKSIKEVGWNAADLRIFNNWYLLDTEKYSVEKLRALRSMLPIFGELKISKKLAAVLQGQDIHRSPQLLLILLLFFLVPGPRFSRWAALVLGLVVVSLLLLLLSTVYLPIRLVTCILLFLGVLSLWNISPARVRQMRNIVSALPVAQRALPCLLFSTFLLLVFFDHFTRCKLILERRANLKSFLLRLAEDKGAKYVAWGSSLRLELFSPFDSMDELKKLELLFIGSNGRCPLTRAVLERWKVRDLLEEFDRKDLRLIAYDHYRDSIRDAIRANQKKRTTFQPVAKINKPFIRVYRVRMKPLENDSPTD